MSGPYAPKFYSLFENNIDLNFGDGLNFIICEHFVTFAQMIIQYIRLRQLLVQWLIYIARTRIPALYRNREPSPSLRCELVLYSTMQPSGP